MDIRCLIGLHKSKLNTEHKYISNYIENGNLPFVIGVYDVTCPRCGKYREAEKVFPFDDEVTIIRRKEMKEKYEDYSIGYITKEEAIFEAKNFKGD